MRIACLVIGICAGAAFFWLAARVRYQREQGVGVRGAHRLAAALAILFVAFNGALSLFVDNLHNAHRHPILLLGFEIGLAVVCYAILLWGWRHA